MKVKKGTYLNNPNLPTVDATFEFTPERVRETVKCKNNILHFAENYFHIIHTDNGKQVIALHSFQKKALRMIRDNRFNLLLFSRQVGKALALDTPVPIPSGWTTMGELKAGDKVYNAQGGVCNVVHAHETLHNRECYEIQFDSGERIVADGEHQWSTIVDYNQSVKTTKEIFNTVDKGHQIPNPCSTKNHTIISVTAIESVPVRCISVDSADNLFLVGKQYIPTHNTTITTIFLLWHAIFNKDQHILLVANKEDTAKEIFGRVRMAYEELPNWLKPGVKEYGKEGMELANGSKIKITTTTSAAGRGSSCNVLFVDEADHIDANLLTGFWASVYPIISSSTKSKIILASTPRDTAGLFYRLYQKSISNDPENVWVSKVVKWDEVPGRDENWVRQTKAAMDDPTLFDREFNCVFAEIGESAIDQSYFELLKSRCSAPEHILDDGDYKVWQLPREDKIYVAGVDISEGVGQDASCIQMLDITDPTNIIQVAQYYSTTISPFQFTPKLHEILQNWGNPLAMIERNNCGAQVVDNLKNVYNYENIVCYGQKEANRKNSQLGVISHTNTKSRGVTNMRYWVTTNKAVQFNDAETVSEIRTFQKGNNATWKAANGKRDDRVMSLVWALMILSEELVTKYFDIIEVDNYNKPLIIKPLDFGIKYYMNPTTIYTDKGDGGNALPVIWGGYSGNADIDDLSNDGWQFLGDFSNGR